jgi:carbon storage regulator
MAMLVLSRKTNERILVGDNIEIIVLGVRRDRVSFGFTAASEISICRSEVLDRISAEAAKKSLSEVCSQTRSETTILHA